MATAARLSALASVALGFAIVISVPASGGSGLAALVGWVGLLIMGIGLYAGLSGTVTIAALALVVQLVIVAGLPGGLTQPIWLHTLFLVLLIEFATASLSIRSHASDLVVLVGRAVALAVVAASVVQLMTVVIAGGEVGGVLVRAAGVGAMVMAGGWAIHLWRRSVGSVSRG